MCLTQVFKKKIDQKISIDQKTNHSLDIYVVKKYTIKNI